MKQGRISMRKIRYWLLFLVIFFILLFVFLFLFYREYLIGGVLGKNYQLFSRVLEEKKFITESGLVEDGLEKFQEEIERLKNETKKLSLKIEDLSQEETIKGSEKDGSASLGQISFWAGASAISGDNSLFWDNNNKRLGLGTSLPQSKLEVVGTARFRSVSGETGLYVDSLGNVGIGTTKPNYKLDIAGIIRVTGNALLGTITQGVWQGSVISNSYGGTGLSYLGNSNQILGVKLDGSSLEYKDVSSLVSSGSGISISGTSVATITNTGVLSLNSLNGSLNLQGTTNQINVSSGGSIITLSTSQDIHTGASPAFAGLALSNLNLGSVLFSDAWGTISQNNSQFYWDNTNYRLGIGTVTPQYSLDVAGNIRVQGFILSTGAQNGYVLTSDSSGMASWQPAPSGGGSLPSGTSGQTLRYDGTDWVGNSFLYNNGTAVGIGTVTPQYALDVAGTAHLRGDSGLTGLYVDSSGNVGVGTVNPQYRLDVAGVSRSNFFVENRVKQAGERYLGRYLFNLYGSDFFVNSVSSTFDHTCVLKSNGNVDCYGDNYYGQVKDYFFIMNDGNIGIGTTVPGTYKLRVSGTVCFDTDADGTCDESWSDVNLKKDIEGLNDALTKIRSLNPVEFTFRYDEERFKDLFLPTERQIGLIAQEVEQVLPNLVETSSVGYKMVKYEKFAPLLIAGIKEQQKQIDEIKEMISLNSLGNVEEDSSKEFINFSILEQVSQFVKQALANLGLTIENGIARFKELIVEGIFVKNIKVENMEVLNRIQIRDQATGEFYCTWIENGEWNKVKGECKNEVYSTPNTFYEPSPSPYPEVLSVQIVESSPSPTPEITLTPTPLIN